jgi:hypothetical protein
MTTERKHQVQGNTRKKSSERQGVTTAQYNRTEESIERKQSIRGPGGTDTMTSMKQHYMSKIQTLNQ